MIWTLMLLSLVACDKQPAETPKAEAPKAPVQPEVLPNYRKGVIKMQRAEYSPANIERARANMPDLIAKAETLYLRDPGSSRACAAWDRVAENAMRQNDPALVHLWGTLADKRCAQSGRETRYWQMP